MNHPQLLTWSDSRWLLAGAALLVLGPIPAAGAAQRAASLQEATRDAAAPTDTERELQRVLAVAGQLGDETLRWVARELGQERIVKGAPYCADAVHESIQPLTDGNRIVQRQQTRLCRDGEGRTRQDISGKDGRRTVYLRDPVAGESWVLDPERRTARRSLGVAMARTWPDEGGAGLDASAWRESAERLREWARQMAERARDVGRGTPGPSAPPMPPAAAAPAAAPVAPVAPTPPAGALLSPSTVSPVVISRTETRSDDARHQDVEIQVLRLPREMTAAAPMPGMSQLFNALPPPAVGFHAGRLAPRGPGVVSPLPARDIEGVRAHGERTTWTIEAGKLGNEKPIVITREVWTSPELMLTLLSRDSDPRSGEVIYRLQNLKRGEPEAALMKVPGDYDQSPRRAPKAPAAAPRG
jgi:hypothetical protein